MWKKRLFKMNGYIKAIIKIDFINIVAIIIGFFGAWAIALLIGMTVYPVAMFIGSFIGTRIFNVLEYRNSLKDAPEE